jgi:hypothetical protein
MTKNCNFLNKFLSFYLPGLFGSGRAQEGGTVELTQTVPSRVLDGVV